MKIITDHGWPVASDGSDGNGLEAFKNERDYISQSGRLKTTVAAMDWAIREIERLSAPAGREDALSSVAWDNYWNGWNDAVDASYDSWFGAVIKELKGRVKAAFDKRRAALTDRSRGT